MNLAAIYLAAGQSQRLGVNKLLLPYKKLKLVNLDIMQPLILHGLYTLLQLNISKIIIVTGYQANQIKHVIKTSLLFDGVKSRSTVDFILNKNYRLGMASSISVGMSQISSDIDAVLICLADKPRITPKTIIQIIYRANRSRKSIILPVYRDREGHPVLFKRKYFSQLRRLFFRSVKTKQDYGARIILENNITDISRVIVNDIGIIQDIDIWQDYVGQVGRI